MSATDKWGQWQVVIGIIGVIISLVGLMVAITPHNPNDKSISISPTLTQIFAVTPVPSSETPTPLATTSPKPPVTPIPVDISPYLDWSFTTAKDNLYVTVPDGYSFVSVTIKIHNDGDDPISTDSSCWKFISDGVSYSCEPVTTAFDTPSQYEVKPGESLTFIINYLVKGVPTTGSLQYNKPTYYN